MKLAVLCTQLLLFLNSFISAQAPYINSSIAETQFSKITESDMEVIKSKRILFASRSFGLNLINGIERLAKRDPIYNILDSYVRYDVFNAGGNLNIIPPDIYTKKNIVHFLATASPNTTRLFELKKLITSEPHYFQDDIHVAFAFQHNIQNTDFEEYTEIIDTLQKQFPHNKIIYTTAACMDSTHKQENELNNIFNTKMRQKYKGKVPLYDLGYILTNDSSCGIDFCPGYSTDPSGVHPNTEIAEELMAKAFLVMMYELFCKQPVCTKTIPGPVPQNIRIHSVSNNSLRFTWTTAASDCPILQYMIKRDGVVVGYSTGMGFSDHNLVDGIEYSYQIATVTSNSLISEYSPAVSFKTTIDTIKPVVLAIPQPTNNDSIKIIFSEKIDSLSAVTSGNITFKPDLKINKIKVEDSILTLFVNEMKENITYVMALKDIADRSVNKNKIASSSYVVTYKKLDIQSPDGYWTFNGHLQDSSIYKNHAQWVGEPQYAKGIADSCLEFSGTNDGGYVTLPLNVMSDSLCQVTFAVWVKKKDQEKGGKILLKHVNLDMTVNGVFSGYAFNVDGSRSDIYAKSASMKDTNWHHYAMVYDGNTLFGYIDGVIKSRKSLTGAVRNNANTIYLGKDPWGTTFNGFIDELQLFKWALDSCQIPQIMFKNVNIPNDSFAVRALLDANGLAEKRVDGVAVFDSSKRVVELYIQEGGITAITWHIGVLTKLRVLHCYGDRKQKFPLLKSIAPEISNCKSLRQLLVNQNELTELPEKIISLDSLTNLSIGDNKLCNLNDNVKKWADKFDPDWNTTQNCTDVNPYINHFEKKYFKIEQKKNEIRINTEKKGALNKIKLVDLSGRIKRPDLMSEETVVWKFQKQAGCIYFLICSFQGQTVIKKVNIYER